MDTQGNELHRELVTHPVTESVHSSGTALHPCVCVWGGGYVQIPNSQQRHRVHGGEINFIW